MGEFELIRHYFRDRVQRSDVRLGPGDDAALLQPRDGCQLVMTMDTLLAGVHFPHDLPPHAIGYRALATNLSDLAAMGADACWCLLSLSLPTINRGWLDGFCNGLFQLADTAGTSLVGGDMVKGPLAITIQATGQLPAGQALLRSGAQDGDIIAIGGAPGEAAAGLKQWQRGQHQGHLVERFCYPEPQLALGKQLRGQAHSCIDISDGLLADLGHILEESGNLGATIRLNQLPTSAALAAAADTEQRIDWQLSGGDDYLLLFTQPASTPLPLGCTAIGEIHTTPGISLIDATGKMHSPHGAGWQHF